jgi:hypothetical protein
MGNNFVESKQLSDCKRVNERNLRDVHGEYWELNSFVTFVTLLTKGRVKTIE